MVYTFSLFILGLQALMFIAVFIVMVYLIARRIQIKKQETFEQRDN